MWLGKGLVGDLGGAAGGLGRRQHHALVAARLVTGGVCVCVCLCVWCLFELIAKAMTSQVVVAALGMNRHGIEYHWQ